MDIEKVYDDQGRLIQNGEKILFYEGDNLVKVVSDGLEVLFSYDEEGRKVSKEVISEDGRKSSAVYMG